jgi:hypothetical protein
MSRKEGRKEGTREVNGSYLQTAGGLEAVDREGRVRVFHWALRSDGGSTSFAGMMSER